SDAGSKRKGWVQMTMGTQLNVSSRALSTGSGRHRTSKKKEKSASKTTTVVAPSGPGRFSTGAATATTAVSGSSRPPTPTAASKGISSAQPTIANSFQSRTTNAITPSKVASAITVSRRNKVSHSTLQKAVQ